MLNEITFKDIWNKLSAIDVQSRVQKKGNFNYLPWSWAWATLMEHYPSASYSFKPPVTFPDGSCEVWVKVTIDGNSRKMFLPVMDFKNNSMINPSSRHISDTRMRCLVKCIGMFGLGQYIYSGEGLPELRGQTTGDLLEFEVITKAYNFFKAKILADTDEPDYQAMQDTESTLNTMNKDYMIEVMSYFGKEKPEGGKRQFKNILADCLKMQLNPDGTVMTEEVNQ